ncbi:threonylcarbamoyl-AMP synthase [Candidatus Micrarchaeota archaeon]|nr:threonylcarbamoyl-AMP synthase [Candidatus Micrarchaeota archaeon]
MAEIIRYAGGDIDRALYRAKDAVLSGKVLIYPTDTVYGIGGDATRQETVDRVRKIKGLGSDKPLSVMMADMNMIEEYCEIGLWEEMILKRYLPGPHTFILKLNKPLPVSSDGTLGVRIPESDFCNRLSEEVAKPIVSTSANKTGELPPTAFEEIGNGIVEAADIAVDNGPTRYRKSSDVVDLVNKKIIRKGVGVIDLTKFPEY